MLSDSHKHFIWQSYFFQLYGHLCIPCLKDILPGIPFYMHASLYVSVYINIHNFLHAYRYIHRFMLFCPNLSIHAYVYTYLPISFQTYVQIHVSRHVCILLFSSMVLTYIHNNACLFSYIHTYIMNNECFPTYIHISICAYIHILT